ncbi:MAG: prolipoprotein diacylglyceryl transferase [Rhodoluna sp.]
MNSFYASIPSPSVSSITVGPFVIHFYALFILAGIVLAIWMANNRLTKRGGESGVAIDIALWAVPFGIVGGRIFHVLTHLGDYFSEGADITAIFRIWEGGLAIYGAILFGLLGAWIGARTAGVRFWSFVDAVAPGVLLAQALGRWGNYFNQELFGTPTTLPWGLEIDSNNPAYPLGLPAGVLFHPTFLYESLWSLAGVFLLLKLDQKFDLRWGKMFALYIAFYSLGRIWTESLRIDPSEVFLGLRTNIWSALAGIAAAIVIWRVQSRRHPGLETSIYVAGKEPKSATESPVKVDSEV